MFDFKKAAQKVTQSKFFVPVLVLVFVIVLIIVSSKVEMFTPFDTDPGFTLYSLFPASLKELIIGKELISNNPAVNDLPTYYVPGEYSAEPDTPYLQAGSY